MIDTFGTGKCSDEKILDIVHSNFDFSVSNIINELDLRKPIYEETSCYGHFGRNEFPWEKIKVLQIG
jgi:S-adenosylmethionine synthetase